MAEIISPWQQRQKDLKEFMTTGLQKSFAYIRVAVDDETRPMLFPEVLWIFQELYDQRSKPLQGLWCRECVRLKRCIKSERQGFICAAYFLWSDVRITHVLNTEERRTLLQTLPLVWENLAPLLHVELLGIFYLQQWSLYTTMDFSKVGLRKKLLENSQNTSPYLLTVQ